MKKIHKVAVLGAGVMGSAIACHMANAGMEVVLLDIVHSEDAQAESHTQRNRWTAESLKKVIKSKPSPLFRADFVHRIQVGNLQDDLGLVSDCQWVIEVIIERLDIKQKLFERLEPHLTDEMIVTTNTSGIPIHMIEEGRSEKFKKCFFGAHFFNPPRYLQLLEIIPGTQTDPQLLDQFSAWASLHLGKTTVRCKDTPAFIANRIGVFAMAYIYAIAQASELPISTIDKLTGPSLSRPKTGTFRLGDLVGLDVADKVIQGIKANCPNDKMIQSLEVPAYFTYLIDQKWYGNKSGQGFYKKTKDEHNNTKILELNLDDKTYVNKVSVDLESLQTSKQVENPKKRIQAIYEIDDAGGRLVKQSLLALFAYVSHRIPEIADDIQSIDEAVKAGFGWSYGPFEYWDIIGVQKAVEDGRAAGFEFAAWVDDFIASGNTTFYQTQDAEEFLYSPLQAEYAAVRRNAYQINLHIGSDKTPVLQNEEMTLHDIGDGVLCMEFTSKMNSIGEGILTGLNQCIDLAEEEGWNGLVIGNMGTNFSVGANLMMIAMMAYQQQYDMLNMAVKTFQDTSMRCRYSDIPVVSATRGYVFGGGCELSMHCDSVAAAAESYIGLVEVGVGLIPGGGGTKEFALRLGDGIEEGDVKIPMLLDYFKSVAMAKVGTSAYEAFDLHYLNEKDFVVMNKEFHIGEAKKRVLDLSPNYQRPISRKDVEVLGREGLGALYVAANELKRGGWASAYDIEIAHKLAYVLCGGDLSKSQKVSEQYLLDIEREAFLSLCTQPKTMERIQHMLEKNKPLRN